MVEGCWRLYCRRQRAVCGHLRAEGLSIDDRGGQALDVAVGEVHAALGGSAIRLVRREGWKRLARLPGHAEPVQCLSCWPDAACTSCTARHALVGMGGMT